MCCGDCGGAPATSLGGMSLVYAPSGLPAVIPTVFTDAPVRGVASVDTVAYTDVAPAAPPASDAIVAAPALASDAVAPQKVPGWLWVAFAVAVIATVRRES